MNKEKGTMRISNGIRNNGSSTLGCQTRAVLLKTTPHPTRCETKALMQLSVCPRDTRFRPFLTGTSLDTAAPQAGPNEYRCRLRCEFVAWSRLTVSISSRRKASDWLISSAEYWGRKQRQRQAPGYAHDCRNGVQLHPLLESKPGSQ